LGFKSGLAVLSLVCVGRVTTVVAFVSTVGGESNPMVHFVGGLLATLVQSTVMVPVEVVRQRQMVQTSGEGSYTVVPSLLFPRLQYLFLIPLISQPNMYLNMGFVLSVNCM